MLTYCLNIFYLANHRFVLPHIVTIFSPIILHSLIFSLTSTSSSFHTPFLYFLIKHNFFLHVHTHYFSSPFLVPLPPSSHSTFDPFSVCSFILFLFSTTYTSSFLIIHALTPPFSCITLK